MPRQSALVQQVDTRDPNSDGFDTSTDPKSTDPNWRCRPIETIRRALAIGN
ncbi:hypothetical protein [Lysobacter sp. Hz 25]|uniref:hypothetical protein n=1 Tax=Lysobacter sp. Hz 25 TaxID=3383698 RepID=UPI0038D50CF0